MEQLLQQLQHADPTKRYAAAQQLSKHSNQRAVAGLVAVLTDDNPKVRYAALSSLVKISDPNAATPTIAALLNDLDSRLWSLLTLDIGMRLRNGLFDMVMTGNTPAADLLVDALENASLSEPQRALVIRLIGRTGDPRMVDTFVDMLALGSDMLQASAAEALGYIGDGRAVPPLIAILEDTEDSALCEITINALAALGDDRANEIILPMLNSADEWTRRAAATAMATLGDRRAVRQLLRMQREDESQVVREAAGHALTRLIMDNGDA
jgi:HEAT repeat protein